MGHSWGVLEQSVGCPWTPHGLSIDDGRIVFGHSMDCSVNERSVECAWGAHGLPMDGPWGRVSVYCIVDRASAVRPRTVYGHPTDEPRTPHRLSMNTQGLFMDTRWAPGAHPTDRP